MIINNNTLLITGSIYIEHYNIPSTVLTDLNERLEQYLFSIEYAIKNYSLIDQIVFCENTNYKHDYSRLLSLGEEYNKKIEIISFLGNYQLIEKYGKGYGEGEIIKYALEHSSLLRNSHSFYKLTGRLIISNMDTIIRKSKNSNIFIYGPAETRVDNHNHVETFFYKADKSFYTKHLIDSYKLVSDNDEVYLERVFYNALRDKQIKSFRCVPHIKGQSGSRGNRYEIGPKERFRESIFVLLGTHNIEKSWIQKKYLKLVAIFLKFYR